MLNNLKLKIKNYDLSKHFLKTENSMPVKHYIPADKEWFNSIYTYNKNTLPLLPVADKVILKSIKSYFNLYNYKLERKASIRNLETSLRELSTNRILVSKPELKHNSDRIIITVYVYNRQRSYYISKLISIGGAIINLNEENYIIEDIVFSNLLLSEIKEKCLKVMKKIYEQKKSLLKTLNEKNKNKSVFFFQKNYERKYLKKLLFKCLQKEMLLMHLRQIISFNKSKFEKTSLLPLINLIKNVYNKKVEFNLVNIKYLYLNSYIFSETLVTKIINNNNTVEKILKTSLSSLNIPPLDKLSTLYSTYDGVILNSKVNYLLSKNVRKKKLKTLSNKNNIRPVNTLNTSNINKNDMTSNVLNYLKHSDVTGIRIEAAGRLTRHSGAEKSVFKFEQLGSLKNIDSSYKGFPSVLLRGYAKSNVQYTKLKSKLPAGSFGLKGWVATN